MTLIGLLADTHIVPAGKRQLPPQVFEAFQGVDLILHAGDLNTLQVVTDLECLAPVIAVRGNNDEWDAIERLPVRESLEIEDCFIGLAHGDSGTGTDTAARALSHFHATDCVVFGHSHQPLIEWRQLPGVGRAERDNRVLLFNPGSPTQRRRAPHHSCGLLRVEGSRLDARLITW